MALALVFVGRCQKERLAATRRRRLRWCPHGFRARESGLKTGVSTSIHRAFARAAAGWESPVLAGHMTLMTCCNARFILAPPESGNRGAREGVHVAPGTSRGEPRHCRAALPSRPGLAVTGRHGPTGNDEAGCLPRKAGRTDTRPDGESGSAGMVGPPSRLPFGSPMDARVPNRTIAGTGAGDMADPVAGIDIGKDGPDMCPDGEDRRLPADRDGFRVIAKRFRNGNVGRVILEAAGRSCSPCMRWASRSRSSTPASAGMLPGPTGRVPPRSSRHHAGGTGRACRPADGIAGNLLRARRSGVEKASSLPRCHA